MTSPRQWWSRARQWLSPVGQRLSPVRQWLSRVPRGPLAKVHLTRRNGIIAGASAAVVVALVVVLAVVATSGGHRKQLAATPTATPTPSPTHTTTPPKRRKPPPKPRPKPKPINPLTGGRPSPNSVVAVKIDDTGAGRPQRGIDKADIVYVEQAEGGLTRLLAVYDSKLPVVEPVRSTRAGDEALAMQYGPIDYVASGGSAGELAPLYKSTLRPDINDAGGPGFDRDSSRSAPYNLTANLSVVAAKRHGPRAKDIGLTWSPKIVNGSRAAGEVHTLVGGTPVDFYWQNKLHRYARAIGGSFQHAADGAWVTTPNVVVQFCRVTVYGGDVDTAGNPAMYTHTIGWGRVAVYRDGRRIDGTWSRSSTRDGTHLKDKHGQPIALAPGGAWFILVANTAPLH